MSWERHHVISSNLKEIAYDPDAKGGPVLEITFQQKGAVYEYYGVHKEQWEGLKAASSKGEYFHRVIQPACASYQKKHAPKRGSG